MGKNRHTIAWAYENDWINDPVDACECCMGVLGGSKGNENCRALSGKIEDIDRNNKDTYAVLCDYCSARIFDCKESFATKDEMLAYIRKQHAVHFRKKSAGL